MKFLASLILAAGLLVLAAGLFYVFFVAGIPYQDPPPEIIEKYDTDLKTGERLLQIGAGTILSAILLLISRRFLAKLK